jgi:L-asparaginase
VIKFVGIVTDQSLFVNLAAEIPFVCFEGFAGKMVRADRLWRAATIRFEYPGAPDQSSRMRLRVISTGGTIDKVYFDAASTYDVGEPQVGPLFKEANVTFEYAIESVLQKDSLNMTDEDRALIRQRVEASPEKLILITHGTDTMTETAAKLAGIPDKVIVFTGSMLPARFRSSDALFNLGCAVGALQVLPPGVYIAMNGQIAPAGAVKKNRAMSRFEPKG